MKRQHMSALLWVTKMQWRASPLAYLWSVFYSLFSGIHPIAQTYALAQLLAYASRAVSQPDLAQAFYVWLFGLLALQLLDQLLTSIDRLIKHRFEQKFRLVVTERYFNKLYELSQEQFEDQAFNTQLDRAQDGLIQLGGLLSDSFRAVSSLVSFVGSIAAIIVIDPLIGGLIAITVLPAAILEIRQNKLREKAYKQSEPYDRVAYRTRWMLLDVNYMPEIRLMNAFKKLVTVWRTNMTKSNDIDYIASKKQALYDSLVQMIQPIVGVLANIHFFNYLLTGLIGFDRFIFLRGLIDQASNGAMMLAYTVQRLHEASINLDNFSQVFDTPPAIPNGSIKVTRPLTIEFENVNFSYPGSNELALKDVSFLIVPGSKLALVGENGAGKSTLIKLLLRQYLPSSGSITVNGHNIADIDRESYYDAISNLSQEFMIVPHLTIKDNLVMGLEKEPSNQTIYRMTDLVDASSFVKKLPHKLNSRLDTSFDDGTNLSGGQKQRLGVARALLREGDIMILDEPTSAIDAKTEYTIFNNIYKQHSDKTTLIVSHRFSTVRKADKIMVMERGEITEYGSHEELLEYGKLYKELFEAQAEGYK